MLKLIKLCSQLKGIFVPYKDLMEEPTDVSTVQETEMPPNESSYLSSHQDFLKKAHAFLKSFPFTFIVLLSLLLIGVEEFMEIFVFVCPCRPDLNAHTVFIFIGPAFVIFELLFLFLRPFKERRCYCCGGANDDTQQNSNDDTQQSCPKAFASCLIPSVMWVLILLLDGDYVACAMTDWKGDPVFDYHLDRSWCKPVESFQNETVLRDLTLKYIHHSQVNTINSMGCSCYLMHHLKPTTNLYQELAALWKCYVYNSYV